MKTIVVRYKNNLNEANNFINLMLQLKKYMNFDVSEVRLANRNYIEGDGFEHTNKDEVIASICKICDKEGFKYEILNMD
ncbi:MAG: hypothetical protein ACK5QC_02980 [Bacteroidota bacterium]|jgi:hypothetical protein